MRISSFKRSQNSVAPFHSSGQVLFCLYLFLQIAVVTDPNWAEFLILHIWPRTFQKTIYFFQTSAPAIEALTWFPRDSLSSVDIRLADIGHGVTVGLPHSHAFHSKSFSRSSRPISDSGNIHCWKILTPTRRARHSVEFDWLGDCETVWYLLLTVKSIGDF